MTNCYLLSDGFCDSEIVIVIFHSKFCRCIECRYKEGCLSCVYRFPSNTVITARENGIGCFAFRWFVACVLPGVVC